MDLQMQLLRQLEGIFKEMEETNGQLGIGKRPWTLKAITHITAALELLYKQELE